MKKIYFLINSLEWWGAERVVINMCVKYSKDYNITIITLKNSNFYDLPDWVKVIALSNVKVNFLMFFMIPYFVYKFKKILLKEKFDKWISFLEFANFVHILAKPDAVISFRIHISFFHWIIGSIYKLMIKRLYPKASNILVNSFENKYDLAEYLGVDDNMIEFLPNIVDTEKIVSQKNEKIDSELLQKISWKKVFVTVWRLVWQKHHDRIIKWFGRLYDSAYKNFVYLIVWDGDKRSELELLVNSLWLNHNVIFVWKQKNVFKFLNIADCFVYASSVEWFPNVLLEAVECKLPIISSDFKSWAKEVVLGRYEKGMKIDNYPCEGKNGILIDFDRYEDQFMKVAEKWLK